MKIFLGADHAGFELKEEVKRGLKGLNYTVHDEGAFELDENDDYPDFVHLVARQVGSDPESRGLLFGGSGQGEAITANRYPGVRASVYYGGSEKIIELSRLHNHANILSIGARFVAAPEALEMIKVWLAAPESQDERHLRRIAKIDTDSSQEPEF